MMQLIDVARMLRSISHVGQPLDRRRRRLRVQGRQHEVAGHRSAERDLGRLLVADLADEQHVGVGAKHRAKAVREREPRPRVDLDLIQACGAVLDRILDRRQLPVRRVEHLQARVEGRRLAGARGADDDDGAERLGDRALERGAAARPHAERVERVGCLSLGEDAERDLLAVRRRQDRDAHVDRSLPRLIETRPSCGARRSAMSRPPMILSRLETAAPCEPAIEVSSRMTPSTRTRTKRRRCCGVKWMSEAPRSRAFEIARLMKTTAGVLWSRSRTVASSSVSWASVTTSSIVDRRVVVDLRDHAARSRRGEATQTCTGIPRASRSSSENITFVGSATATRT